MRRTRYPSPLTSAELTASRAHAHKPGGNADAHRASDTPDGSADGADAV
jgi:hypothetical protein